MFPIIFAVGNFNLYTSSLIIAFGFLVSLFYFWKKTRVEIIEEERIFDFVLVFILSAFFFGRLIYVFDHANDFQFWFDRIIHIYKYPGFNFWGLCFGGLLGSFIYFKRVIKSHTAYLFDALGVALSLFLGFSFLAFFADGVYVGPNTAFLGVKFVGLPGYRFPIQIPAAILFFAFYFVVNRVNLKRVHGMVFWLFSTFFFGIFLALEFFRHDRIYFEGIVINQFTFFLVSLFSGIIFIIKYKNHIIRILKDRQSFKK